MLITRLIVVGDDDILEEAKKTWEQRKMFEFSTDNEIDAIRALAKNRRDNKGKKNNPRGQNKGRKEGKSDNLLTCKIIFGVCLGV